MKMEIAMKVINSELRPIEAIRYTCMYVGNQPVTCYVIRGKNGDMLIDTGFCFTYDELMKWLKHYDIKHIFLTHAHVDHDLNAARLKKELGADIILNQRDLSLIRHYSRQPVKATKSKYFFRNIQQNVCGPLFRTNPYTPDILLTSENRNLLHELGYDADVVFLPGHTLGSTGIISCGVLYCGDAFTAFWGKPEITPHATSIKLMKRSLETILKLSPEWISPGHGLPVRMESAIPVINGYLADRI